MPPLVEDAPSGTDDDGRVHQLALPGGDQADRPVEAAGDLLPCSLDGEPARARAIRPAHTTPTLDLVPVPAAVADEQPRPLLQEEGQAAIGTGTHGPTPIAGDSRGVSEPIRHYTDPSLRRNPAASVEQGGAEGCPRAPHVYDADGWPALGPPRLELPDPGLLPGEEP